MLGLALALNIYTGLRMISISFLFRSESRIEKVPVEQSRVVCVALDHRGGSMMPQDLYGMLHASSIVSSVGVRRLPLDLQTMGMPWKTTHISPSAGSRSNMLGPKGLSIASLYL